MKIKVLSHDDSEEDCRRESYYTEATGERVYLSSCALGSYYTFLEIQEKARKLFGADVELDLSQARHLETTPH